MKKVVMSVIGFAIAIVLVIAIWVPLATHGKNTATLNEGRFDTVDGNISTLAVPIAVGSTPAP